MADSFRSLFSGLAALLRSGLVMERALHTLRQNGTLKEPLGSALAGAVAGGTPLSTALAENAAGVMPEELALIEAGETTGNLDRVLDRLANMRTLRAEQARKFKTASYYPVIMWHAAAFCMPIGYMGIKGRLSIDGWIAGILGILAPLYLVAIGFSVLRHNRAWRVRWRKIVDKLPGFGRAALHARRARFTTVLGAAYESAVPLDRAAVLAANAAGVPHEAMVNVLQSGQPLAVAVAADGLYDADTISRISTGETSGELSRELDAVATEEFAIAEAIFERSMMVLKKLMFAVMALAVLGYAAMIYMSYFSRLFRAMG